MSRLARTALLACLALAFGLVAGAGCRRPAAGPRPRAVLRQPGDRRRPALARRPVRRLPEALEGHPQHLGQEDGRALRGRAAASPPRRSGRSPASSGRRDSRLILYVKDNDGDENYNVWAVDPAAAKAEGKEVPPSRNLTDAKGARAFIYDVPEEVPGHDLRRPQRPRRRLARRLQGLDLHRQARAPAQEHRPHRGLDVRPRGPAPPGGAHHRQRRHRGPAASTPGRLQDGLHLHRVRDLRPRPLPQGRQARLHADEQGRRRTSSRLVLFDPATGKEELVESDPMNRVDFGGAIFSEATDELVGTSYEDEQGARLLPRQGVGGRLQAAPGQVPGQGHRPSGRPPPTTGSG